MARRAVKVEQTDLPKHVTKADLEYPKWNPKKPVRVTHTLRFLQSGRFGWCVATLDINSRQQRTYGRTLDGSTVTMGNPSSQFITVYVREGREAAMKPWIDAYNAGMEAAGDIRDRIGSRRAEGQEMRAQCRTSWLWSK